MDSLSQITLGAAVGELLLGKKLGNRAMVWGAVIGTVPDLDVIGNYFLSDLQGLLFHRGISHSILFSVIGAIALGWIVFKMYESKEHKWIAISAKVISALVVLNVVHFVASIFSDSPWAFMLFATIAILGFTWRHIKNRYLSGNWEKPQVSLREWQWAFFWIIATHILLDVFTLYGTRVFAPFSNYKAQFGTVSVADPLYTAPFLLLLIVASFYNRNSKKREWLNKAGLIVSCLYLAITVSNKFAIDKQFNSEFDQAGLTVTRYITNATILNNVLWTCTAETEDFYYVGDYSFFDEVPVDFFQIEKNHHLLRDFDVDPTITALRWFSDDFYCITERDDSLFFNDLRFGLFRNEKGEPTDFIFSFYLEDLGGEEGYKMHKYDGGPSEDERKNFFSNLIRRIKGKRLNS